MYIVSFKKKKKHDSLVTVSVCTTAREQRIDVVLVDTAGRMQDNEPLMRALSKVS